MTDINDQLKRHANQARLQLELSDIIDKLGGLEQMETNYNQGITQGKETLAKLQKAVATEEKNLEAAKAEVSKAEAQSKDIIASANQAAEVIIKSAKEEADDKLVSSKRSLDLASKAHKALEEKTKNLLAHIEAKNKELVEVTAKIEEAKTAALKVFQG
jgi:chromosome segregation ATPase